MSQRAQTPRVENETAASTGVVGLDDVLSGGLTRNRLYLVEGVPGSGKTTLALQFLLEGVRLGETVLYVTLSETSEELQAVAKSHGWSLDGVHIRELAPGDRSLDPDDQFTMFHPAEVELASTTKLLLEDVERLKPTRVAFDSLSEFRLLAGTPLRFRRQILALKQFFVGRDAVVLLLDDRSHVDADTQVQSLAHGVVQLDHMNPDYGSDRRRLRVTKYRGKQYRGGHHDYVIRKGGLDVFPRLVAAEHRRASLSEKLPSGVAALDKILGGGVEFGTSILIAGAAGTGKSTLSAQFVTNAASHGRKAAIFAFDENSNTLLARADKLGMKLSEHVAAGRVTVSQMEPAELSPGEFIHGIRRAVDESGASVIVIDSLNGYLNAMPGERHLTIQLHELLSFLSQRGVATFLVGTQLGLVGGRMDTPVDASYLADAIILLRYYETRGELRQIVSVMKKRGGEHERTIREFALSRDGLVIGEPLTRFHGVLTGTPSIEPARSPTSKDADR